MWPIRRGRPVESRLAMFTFITHHLSISSIEGEVCRMITACTRQRIRSESHRARSTDGMAALIYIAIDGAMRR